jgi:hypothetical protein
MAKGTQRAPSVVSPDVPIELDRPRMLRFDLNAFCAFETTVGQSIEAVWGSFDRQPFTSIRALLWAGLLHEEPELTLEGAGRLITPADLYKAGSAIGQALGAAFGEDRAQAPLARQSTVTMSASTPNPPTG